jgi:hypothetical protein
MATYTDNANAVLLNCRSIPPNEGMNTLMNYTEETHEKPHQNERSSDCDMKSVPPEYEDEVFKAQALG